MKPSTLLHFLLFFIFMLGLGMMGKAQSYLQQRRLAAHSASLPTDTQLETPHWLSAFYSDPFVARDYPDSSRFYIERYLQAAHSIGDRYHLIQAYLQQGDALLEKRQSESAFLVYQKADSLNQELSQPELAIDFLHRMGRFFSQTQQADSAQSYFQQALSLSIAQKDTFRQTEAYLSLASEVADGENERLHTYWDKILSFASASDPLVQQQIAKAYLQLADDASNLGQDSLVENYLNQAYEKLEKIDSIPNLYECIPLYWQLEVYTYDWGLIDLEIKCLEKIIELTPRYELYARKSSALFNLGLTYESDFTQSLRYFQWCKTYSDSIGASENQAFARNSLGLFYKGNKEWDKALVYFKEADSILQNALALEFVSQTGKTVSTLCAPLLNAGDVYLLQGNSERAKESYLKALHLTQKWGGGYDKAYVLNSVVAFFEEIGALDSALSYQNRQEAILEAIPDEEIRPGRELYIRQNITDFKLRMGDYEYAIEKYKPLFDQFAEGGNKYSRVIKDGALLLYQSFRGVDRMQDALEMLELHREINDSLNSAENQQATIRFDFQQKALRDSLASEKAQAELKATYDRQVSLRNYGLIVLAAILLGVFFWFRYRRQQQLAEARAAQLAASERLNQQLRRINEATSRFVPTEFLNTLNRKDVTELQRGDYIDRDMTLMFADIRSYTTLAEGMTPEDNFRFVNAYMQRMGPIIRRNQGFVNQYFGDGIMALFQQDSSHALQAAIEMQLEIQAYNLHRQTKNRLPLQVGMGIHTGPLIMGIIGDEDRTDTAVIADTVNVTARLEGLTKYYRARLLLSHDSYRELTPDLQALCRFLGQVQVKGRKQPMGIFECFAADAPGVIQFKQTFQTAFQEGMKAFIAGDMQAVKTRLAPLVKQEDRVAQYFLHRAEVYLAQGLPPNWEGVEVMEGK